MGGGWLLLGIGAALAADRVWVRAADGPVAAATGAALLGADGERLLLGVDARARAALEAAGVPLHPAGPPPPPAPGYPGPGTVTEALAALVSGGHGELLALGPTARGEELVAWVVGPEDARRTWRFIGGTHGDEPISTLVVLELARALAAPGVLPADTRVVLVPALNADGLRANTRENAAGVDINRDHGHGWSAAQVGAGPAPWSTPEARAIRALADRVGASVGVTVHAGAANLGWPWNWTEAEPAGADAFLAFGEAYREALGDPGFWITQGAWWYPTRGDCNDWAYGAWGTADFTLEVSDDKAPPLVEAWPLVDAHVDALLAMLDAPGPAFRVRDTQGGAAPATVRLTGGDRAWTAASGAYFRPFAAGVDAVWVDGAPAAPDGGDWRAPEPSGAAPLRPEPALLSRGGDGTVRIPGGGARVQLVRPGHPSVSLVASDADTFVVPLSQVAPGPWDLVWSDGRRAPRALFIGEADGLVHIARARLDREAGHLVVDGAGFGVGAAAWAIAGPGRRPVPLAVLDLRADTLRLDAAPLGAMDDPVDLLLWTRGRQLAVLDVRGAALTDPTQPDGPPPGTVSPPAASDSPGAARSCANTPRAPVGLLGVSLALLLVLRRRSPDAALVPLPRPGARRL